MITETALRGKIVKMCNESSQSDVARRFNKSRAYISDIVAGKRRISNEIARHLGYRICSINVPVERQYEPLVKNKSAL